MASMGGRRGSVVSSSSSASSPRISPITRIRHARLVHERLQERKWTERSSTSAVHDDQLHVRDTLRPVEITANAEKPARECAPNVESLATELQTLWQKQQTQVNPVDSLLKRVEKIGSREKDALVVHLLQQAVFYQTQRNDVVAVGEKLTTQLVQQQHELRVQFKAQTTHLQQQLEQALHHHPEVARLEETIAQLQEANKECEQKLLFAAQKLHRSRQRERALRLEQESDPLLWDL